MSACLSQVTWPLMVTILLHINQTHSDEKPDQSSYKLMWPLRLMGPPPVVSSAHYLWVHDWVNHLFTQSGSASRLQLSEVPNWTNALTAETDPDIRWHRSFKSSRCVHGQSFILCCACVRLTKLSDWDEFKYPYILFSREERVGCWFRWKLCCSTWNTFAVWCSKLRFHEWEILHQRHVELICVYVFSLHANSSLQIMSNTPWHSCLVSS